MHLSVRLILITIDIVVAVRFDGSGGRVYPAAYREDRFRLIRGSAVSDKASRNR